MLFVWFKGDKILLKNTEAQKIRKKAAESCFDAIVKYCENLRYGFPFFCSRNTHTGSINLFAVIYSVKDNYETF